MASIRLKTDGICITVREALIPINFLFVYLAQKYSNITAAYILMVVLTAIAVFALSQLKESFNKDLNYLEHD